MKEIGNLLNESRRFKKDEFLLKICVKNRLRKDSLDRMGILLLKILNVLNILPVERFTFHVELKEKKAINYEIEEMKKWVSTLISIRSIFTIIIQRQSNMHSFVICKKESTPLYDPTCILSLW